MARIHPVNFFVARKDRNRPLRPHQRRDVGAAMELLPRLFQQGHEYGEPVLNTPPPRAQRRRPQDLLRVDLSFVDREDLLLQTTRPPLDDPLEGPRKQVERAWTDVERRLLDAWRPWFASCSRRRVVLAEKLWNELPEGYENRCDVTFYQKHVCAPYKSLNTCAGGRARRWKGDLRTAAYLLRLERAWTRGPRLLGIFGMDGISNLVWAYRLGRDFAHLLREPAFVMAELAGPPVPDRSTDLRWAMDWDVKVLVHHRPRGRKRARS